VYKSVPYFEQKLNHYHCAKTAFYDNKNKVSYNIFYGGISRFYIDPEGRLIDDHDVPFVKTIGLVSRDKKGNINESSIGTLPDFLGASAEFVPAPDLKFVAGTNILNFDSESTDSQFIGYIIGGIKSSANKVFWINDGNQSSASNQIYKVYLQIKNDSIKQPDATSFTYFSPIAYPNSAFDQFIIEFQLKKAEEISIQLFNSEGVMVATKKNKFQPGSQKIEVPIADLPDGNFLIKLSNGKLTHSLLISK
jgi:hypothetical protein